MAGAKQGFLAQVAHAWKEFMGKPISETLDDGTTAQYAQNKSGVYLLHTQANRPMERPDGSKQHWEMGKLVRVEHADGSVTHYKQEHRELFVRGHFDAKILKRDTQRGRDHTDMVDGSVIKYVGFSREDRTYPNGLIERTINGELGYVGQNEDRSEIPARENTRTGEQEFYSQGKLVRRVHPTEGTTQYSDGKLTRHTSSEGVVTSYHAGKVARVTMPKGDYIVYDGKEQPVYGQTADKRDVAFDKGVALVVPTVEEEYQAYSPARDIRQNAANHLVRKFSNRELDPALLSTKEELAAGKPFTRDQIPTATDFVNSLFAADPKQMTEAKARTGAYLDRIEAAFRRVVDDPNDPLAKASPETLAAALLFKRQEQSATASLHKYAPPPFQAAAARP